MAVFDTGLDAGGHDFDNVMERVNWTDEKKLSDEEGHGTHVAGVVGGRDVNCPGFAPEAELYIFRLFAKGQVREHRLGGVAAPCACGVSGVSRVGGVWGC